MRAVAALFFAAAVAVAVPAGPLEARQNSIISPPLTHVAPAELPVKPLVAPPPDEPAEDLPEDPSEDHPEDPSEDHPEDPSEDQPDETPSPAEPAKPPVETMPPMPPTVPKTPKPKVPVSPDVLDCTARSFDTVFLVAKKCKNFVLKDIRVPPRKVLKLKKLKHGATVTFAGTTLIEHYVMTSRKQEKDFPIQISGTDITIQGAPGSLIDGNGAKWWDGFGSNDPDCEKVSKGKPAARCGGNTTAKISRISKPNHLLTMSKMKGSSVIKNLVIKNYPVHGIRITNSKGVTVQNLTLDVRDGHAPNKLSAPLAAAHNTDGFNVASSTNIVIKDTRVFNQDDCVAITSGKNIDVGGMLCVGGHGLSIGSIGGKSDNVLANVNFHDSKIINNTNAMRIKSNAGTNGSVKNITFQNLEVENASEYGLVIQQDYLNGGPNCNATNGVSIRDITVRNVTGTVSSTRPKSMAVYILCGHNSCSNFTIEGLNLTGGHRENSCNEKTSGLQLDGDFDCEDTGPNCKDVKNVDEQS